MDKIIRYNRKQYDECWHFLKGVSVRKTDETQKFWVWVMTQEKRWVFDKLKNFHVIFKKVLKIPKMFLFDPFSKWKSKYHGLES